MSTQAPSVEVKAAWLAEIQKIVEQPHEGNTSRPFLVSLFGFASERRADALPI